MLNLTAHLSDPNWNTPVVSMAWPPLVLQMLYSTHYDGIRLAMEAFHTSILSLSVEYEKLPPDLRGTVWLFALSSCRVPRHCHSDVVGHRCRTAIVFSQEDGSYSCHMSPWVSLAAAHCTVGSGCAGVILYLLSVTQNKWLSGCYGIVGNWWSNVHTIQMPTSMCRYVCCPLFGTLAVV